MTFFKPDVEDSLDAQIPDKEVDEGNDEGRLGAACIDKFTKKRTCAVGPGWWPRRVSELGVGTGKVGRTVTA